MGNLFLLLLILFIATLPILFVWVFIYKYIKGVWGDLRDERIKQNVYIQQQFDDINARLTELMELMHEKK